MPFFDEFDATPRQKNAIAKLCIALGIKEPLEDRKMTKGGAGKLIRKLEAEIRLRRKKE